MVANTVYTVAQILLIAEGVLSMDHSIGRTQS